MLGKPLDAKEFPFPNSWSSTLQRDLVLSFCWTIEGLAFRPMKEDKKNDWFIERKITHKIDVPAVLVKQKQNLSKPHLNSNIERGTSVAVALSIDPSQTLPLFMGIKCQVRFLNWYVFPALQRVHVYPQTLPHDTNRHTDTDTDTDTRACTHAHT